MIQKLYESLPPPLPLKHKNNKRKPHIYLNPLGTLSNVITIIPSLTAPAIHLLPKSMTPSRLSRNSLEHHPKRSLDRLSPLIKPLLQ